MFAWPATKAFADAGRGTHRPVQHASRGGGLWCLGLILAAAVTALAIAAPGDAFAADKPSKPMPEATPEMIEQGQVI